MEKQVPARQSRAEGQRRYVESLSAYARQFLDRMEKPDVDAIDGICPAIAIRQKNSLRNPRSTVGTTTEIHDYLRLLYARVGRTICRGCGREVLRDSAEIAARALAAQPAGARLLIGYQLPVVGALTGATTPDEEQGAGGTAGDDPVARAAGDGAGEGDVTGIVAGGSAIAAAIEALRRKGFRRVVVDGRAVSLDDLDPAALAGETALSVVVDRVQVDPGVLSRLTGSVETAYAEGGGTAFAIDAATGETRWFSERFECRACGIAYDAPQPRLFSFNNPFGACPTCHGFGNVIELDMDLVAPDPSKSIQQDAIEPWTSGRR